MTDRPARARDGARPAHDQVILDLNLGTGVPMVYHFNPDATIASKLDLAA
jgi:bisphosphoglycerate-dependent phosphoglycerate mutase